MGRKEKKKKKSRARHVARPADQAQNTSAGTTTAIIRSLKGIVSSNDDPYSCHGCSNSLDLRDLMFWSRTSVCCGKMFCCDCAEAGKGPPAAGVACSSCGVSTTRKRSQARAKEGYPWAQFALAWQLQRESPVEARKLYRKAAEKGGHPFAFARLATFYRHGQRLNQTKVVELLEEAMVILLSSECMFDAYLSSCITAMAEISSNIKDGLEMQHELLVPLASKGLRGAQYHLSMAIVYLEGDLSVALELSRKAAVQNGAPRLSPGAPARLAAACCEELDRTVEGLFWDKQAAIANGHRSNKDLADIHSELCEMRKNCSTCGISLNSSNRKLCAGCKISCYCSRDCQKMHWNRPDDGHRDECKTIMKMVEEMEKNKGKTE